MTADEAKSGAADVTNKFLGQMSYVMTHGGDGADKLAEYVSDKASKNVDNLKQAFSDDGGKDKVTGKLSTKIISAEASDLTADAGATVKNGKVAEQVCIGPGTLALNGAPPAGAKPFVANLTNVFDQQKKKWTVSDFDPDDSKSC